MNVIHRNPQPYLPVIKSIQSSDGDVDAQNRKVLYSLVDSGKSDLVVFRWKDTHTIALKSDCGGITIS